MAKEQVQLETMDMVDDAELEILTANTVDAVEEAEMVQGEPEQEEQPVIYEQPAVEAKPKPRAAAEKPKPVKKAVSSDKAIRYVGKNPSYTIGRHRFLRNGAAQKIEKELAEYALGLDCFEEA